MLYHHRIDRCFGDGGGLDRSTFDALARQTRPGIEALKTAQADNSLPLLNLPARQDDLAALAAIAQDFRSRFDDVIVLGTGGSSLGGKTLVALADHGFGPAKGSPRLHFMDNVDPVTFADLEAATDPARTGLIVISKSGSTAETLSQLLALLPRLKGTLDGAALGKATA